MERLHAEYVSHSGHKLDPLREQIGWRRAFCLLSFVLLSGDECWLVHVGDSTIARVEQEEVIRIAPIHNLRHEFAEGTLEEARLTEVARMTTEMAEEIIGVSPNTLRRQMEGKSPNELIELLGTYLTRVIGDRGWAPEGHRHRNTIDVRPPVSFITRLPLTREFELVMLGSIPSPTPFDNEVERKIRLQMETRWPSASLGEVPVANTTRMRDHDFGIRIYWNGNSVQVSVVKVK